MGSMDKIRDAFSQDYKRPGREMTDSGEVIVDFKELNPAEKAVQLWVIMEKNIAGVTANQLRVDTHYRQKLEGTSKYLGLSYDPEASESGGVFKALLEEWKTRRELLRSVTARVDAALTEKAACRERYIKNEQSLLTLQEEKTRLEGDILFGRKQQVVDQRHEELEPTPEKGFQRLRKNLGRGAIVRAADELADNKKRLDQIVMDEMPQLHVTNDEINTRLGELNGILGKCSDELDTIKAEFKRLYGRHEQIMQEFSREMRAFHDDTHELNSGMVPPANLPGAFAESENRQITSPVSREDIIVSTAVTTSEEPRGNFLDNEPISVQVRTN